MKKSHITGLLLIALAILAIITTMGDASSYESFSVSRDNPEMELHIIGHLENKDSIYYDALKDPNYFSFYLKDNDGQTEKVIFYGSKPQDFERSEQIVITGKIDKNHFIASGILMKCPSKYNDTEVIANKN